MGCLSRGLLLTLLDASVLAQSPQSCPAELRRLTAGGISPDLVTDVVGFYESNSYACAWVRDGVITPQARAIAGALNNAGAKGLDPVAYDGLRLGTLMAQLGSAQFAGPEASRFDLALTVSSMRYVSDLCVGRANPQQSHCDLRNWLQRLMNARDPEAVLEEVEPQFDGYKRTSKALQTYRRLAQEDQRVELPASEKPVEPGESYSGAARLSTLLSQLGDLPADTLLPSKPQVYEGALVEAVKRFQLRHGLDPDGLIGNKTRRQLNTPLSTRVRQLQLTLERWRWLPRAFPRPPIVVNIPEFRLRAFDDLYQTGLEMKVVVGKAYRHRTPTFSSELKSVIIRPYWNVPLSIQRAELVPEVERNRSYLVENGYEVVTARREVVAREIIADEILAKLRAGTLFIRQVPGPKNALGSIAFVFPICTIRRRGIFFPSPGGTSAMAAFESKTLWTLPSGLLKDESAVAARPDRGGHQRRRENSGELGQAYSGPDRLRDGCRPGGREPSFFRGPVRPGCATGSAVASSSWRTSFTVLASGPCSPGSSMK